MSALAPIPRLDVGPIAANASLRTLAYDALKRELASYQTAREVDDLLGVIANQEGPEAQQIREILLDNRRPATTLYRAA